MHLNLLIHSEDIDARNTYIGGATNKWQSFTRLKCKGFIAVASIEPDNDGTAVKNPPYVHIVEEDKSTLSVCSHNSLVQIINLCSISSRHRQLKSEHIIQ